MSNLIIKVQDNFRNVEYNPANPLYNLKFCSITVSLANSTDFYRGYDREALWDFGDGTKVIGKMATHYYKRPGKYKLRCTAIGRTGKIDMSYWSEIDITVVELVDTIFELLPGNDPVTVKAGQKLKIGEFACLLGKDIEGDIPVKCHANGSNTPDISELDKSKPFIHLCPFHTFIGENGTYTSSILPEYKELYCTVGNGEIDTLYILDETGEFDIGSFDNASIFPIDIQFGTDKNIFVIRSLDEIGEEYHRIGRVGRISIWYVDDLPGDPDPSGRKPVILSFIYDTESFPDKPGDFPKGVINLVSAERQVVVQPNNTADLKLFISSCGLSTQKDGKLFSDYSTGAGLSMSENIYSVENTWKYVGITNPFVIRLAAAPSDVAQYFVKDINLLGAVGAGGKTVDISVLDSDPSLGRYIEHVSGDYPGSAIVNLVPTKESTNVLTDISVTLANSRGTVSKSGFSLGEFVSFESMESEESPVYLDPKQNYTDISEKDAWDVYKTHPAMQNKPELDKYMTGILGSGFLETAVNKGFNFTDDISNVETCYIRNLISIFDMFNIDVSLYNNENFSRPLSVAELLKIMSISHSALVGTKINEKDEFVTIDNMPGKNLGEEYKTDEDIFIHRNESGFDWPVIVCFDKFDQRYFTVNTALLETAKDFPLTAYRVNGEIVEHYNKENDADPESVEKYSFKLSDYTDDWGWALLLGDYADKRYTVLAPDKTTDEEITELLVKKAEKSLTTNVLSRFYRFYRYIKTENYTTVDSYLRPETISELVRNYDSWYGVDTEDKQGSVDRLLYKELYETLNFDER